LHRHYFLNFFPAKSRAALEWICSSGGRQQVAPDGSGWYATVDLFVLKTFKSESRVAPMLHTIIGNVHEHMQLILNDLGLSLLLVVAADW
jgi:hypothetical protein